MNLQQIVAELKAEREKLDKAIAALNSVSKQPRRGRPPGSTNAPKKRGRRRGMSAAARRKLSRLLKQRWAQGKMKRKKAA